MALETLRGVEEIGGFRVLQDRPRKENGEIDWSAFDELRKEQPIYIDHDVNMISFRIQNGPIKEVGVNGCQVDTLIEAAKIIIEGLNKKFPCRENSLAITKLDEALHWLGARKANREKRGVEGTSKQFVGSIKDFYFRPPIDTTKFVVECMNELIPESENVSLDEREKRGVEGTNQA